MTPLKVGLVGAGPWAHGFHAPMLSAGPGTQLSGVWARRLDAAQDLAVRYRVPAFDDFDEFLSTCEAVAFCVPPAVQAELAIRAAAQGRALLLEKPLADNVENARLLCEAIERHHVASQILLTWRYFSGADDFIASSRSRAAVAGRAEFLLGSALGGPFATPWRLAEGPLPDLGPHVLDILYAALGPIADVQAEGSRATMVTMQLQHETGAVSTASVSITLPVEPMIATASTYSPSGTCTFSPVMPPGPDVTRRIASEFAQTAAGRPHRLDARHGLALQHLIDRAQVLVPQ